MWIVIRILSVLCYIGTLIMNIKAKEITKAEYIFTWIIGALAMLTVYLS